MTILYSVYDRVAGKYNPPFVADNDELARRTFFYGVKSNPFKSDMDLYRIGSFFDDTTGGLVPDYEFICSAPVDSEVK